MFRLHPQLDADTILVGEFPLSLLLLMNDANYPWFILVPKRTDITEIHQLSEKDQFQLTRESSLLSSCLSKEFQPDKLNIAALGNIVPQLHLHHIVRYATDPSWPHPVWGRLPAKLYDEQTIQTYADRLRKKLGKSLTF